MKEGCYMFIKRIECKLKKGKKKNLLKIKADGSQYVHVDGFIGQMLNGGVRLATQAK